MAKPLTSYQLISNIKQLLPRGKNRGGEVISKLLTLGFIQETEPKTYNLCSGVKPTLKDCEEIAKQIDKKAKTFAEKLLKK